MVTMRWREGGAKLHRKQDDQCPFIMIVHAPSAAHFSTGTNLCLSLLCLFTRLVYTYIPKLLLLISTLRY